jgi:hypothetical protein
MLVFHAPSIPDDKQQKHHKDPLSKLDQALIYTGDQVTETLINSPALLLDTQMHMPIRGSK